MLSPYDTYKIVYITNDDEILTYNGGFSYYEDYEDTKENDIRISIEVLKEYYNLKEVIRVI